MFSVTLLVALKAIWICSSISKVIEETSACHSTSVYIQNGTWLETSKWLHSQIGTQQLENDQPDQPNQLTIPPKRAKKEENSKETLDDEGADKTTAKA